MNSRKSVVDEAEHWVVKVGSAVLLRDRTHVDRPAFVNLVEDLATLVEAGKRVTVVSSGAVALGRQRVEPDDPASLELPHLQALAALGQARLIQMYDTEFAQYGLSVAQILFARSDLDRRSSFLNARVTLEAVHRLGAIPVVNENDTVATDELRFGDNDELAAMTCGITGADLLVILSDVPGVLDRRPDGTLGERISSLQLDDPRIDELAGPSQSGVGRGGMISKLAAARSAARTGAPTIIAPGKQHRVLRDILSGADVGTLLEPSAEDIVQGKKVWLGAGARAVGQLHCDDGARRALSSRGASLLPSGITSVSGDFGEGAVVELVAGDGEVFARGLATYRASDIRLIAGRKSEEIMGLLGYKVLDAVVHRDNLVLLQK